MKKSFTLCVLLVLGCGAAMAQPTVLYTGLSSTTPSPTNSRFTLNTVGGFKQARFLSGQTASSGTVGWAFHVGTPSVPDYTSVWRPYTTGNTLSVNTYIPYGYANGARYNSNGGGADGLLPAITSGKYYTFNVTNHTAPTDNMTELLETGFSPVTISSVTQNPGKNGVVAGPVTVTVTTSAVPATGEYVYVRYSTNSFTTSSLALFTFSGTTGTATIPVQSVGTAVSYYIMSSSKTASAIASDIASDPNPSTDGQNAYDMATLNLNNNSGSNYSYTVSSNPVSVTATGGTTSATYATLGAAFTAINAGTHTGVIAILIGGNTTETATATLNYSGSGSASYTSISIQPTGGAARTITGALTGDLIAFNGADNVTIDGLNTNSNSLTLSNTTVGLSVQTLNLYNDATNNTIQNCTILGANTNNSTYGTIAFGVGTSTGNDGNVLNANFIGPVNASTSTPTIAIWSNSGSNTIDNSGIQITNNYIYDFYSSTYAASGIRSNSGFTTGSSTWTITGNRFYQTVSRTSVPAVTSDAIEIKSGSGYTISNNIIGFGKADGTGTTTYTSTANAFTYIGIDFEPRGTSANNIQGNTIGGMSIATASGNTTTYGVFTGIYVNMPTSTLTTNIGTTAGNIIGATSGTGSIIIGSTSGSAILITGINVAAGGTGNTVNIQNNTVASFATANTSSTSAVYYAFRGIITTGTGGAITINGNTIGNTTANSIAIGTPAVTANANVAAGIYNTATGTIVIGASGQGNTIQNIGVYSTSASAGVFGIYNGGAASSVNINYNTVSSPFISTSITSGTVNGSIYGIYNGAAPTSLTANNNTIAGIVAGTSSTQGASSVYGFYNASALSGTLTFSNNVLQNWTSLYTTGIIYGIYQNSATVTENIQGNTITNISRAGTLSGTFYGYYNSGGPSGGTHTVSGNTISNITASGSSVFYGVWASTLSAATFNVYSNTITGITNGSGNTYIFYNNFNTGNYYSNTVNTITSSGSIYGVYFDNAGSSGSGSVYQNIINTFATSGASGVYGIYYNIAAGGTVNTYRNKIYDLSGSNAGSAVYGAYVYQGPTTLNFYNNIIGDLRTPAVSSTSFAIAGYSSASSVVSSTQNVSFNTIYLNASSTGATLNTAGIFYTTSSTATTAALVLRDNVIVNTSGRGTGGTGVAAAYVRSSSTLTNYSASSNNNDFYGTTGLFYDGTNTYTTITAYKAAMSTRDQASVTENPAFVSTTGSSATYLHINTTTPTQLESGGTPVSGITGDYDGDTRNTTTPDIGADEFTGVSLDLTPPVISYTALTSLCQGTNSTLTATITDARSGVPTSGTGLPVLYYKVGSGSYTGVQGVSIGSNQYTFSFGSAATGGSTVSYYIVAQDGASTPNVGAYPSAGSGGFTYNPPAASTPPTSPSTVSVAYKLGGTYTVGAGQQFPTLTAAVAAYNGACGFTGPVVFSLTDASYSTNETFPITIGVNANSGTNTLTIKPASGVSPIISGSVASGALLVLNGADYIIIDGSNTAGGTTKNLTITNTNTTSPTAVSLVSLGTGAGATFNTIKNCNISTGTTTTTLSIGISVGSTPGTSGADNDNTTIQNNSISVANASLYVYGTSGGVLDNLLITGNTISSTNTSNTSNVNYGMVLGYATGATVSFNTVDVNTAYGGTPVGISVETGFVSSIITKNTISRVNTTSTNGWGARGITVGTGVTSSALTISNNFIYGINGSNYSAFENSSSMGIGLGVFRDSTTISVTSGGINLYYNSIDLDGSYSYTTNVITTAVYVGKGASALDIRNNIFSNSLVNTNLTYAASSKKYAIYSIATAAAYTTINYNDYYVGGTTGIAGLAYIGGADQTSLAAIQSSFGGNANSVSGNPGFTSASNPHIPAGTVSVAESAATPISGITTDIDGDTRPGPAGSTYGGGNTPDIGADEFDGVIITAPAITLNTGPVVNCTTAASHTVSVNVSSPTSPVITVTLNYNTGTAGSVNMTLTSGTTSNGVWSGTIPAGTVGTAVTWSVTATNAATLSSTYTGAPYTDGTTAGVTATATTSATSVCSGSSVTLTGNILKSGTVTLGSGASTSASSGTSSVTYASPYSHYYGSLKAQYVIRASELTASGLAAGNLTGLGFNVTSAGTSYNGFTISIAPTTNTTATSTLVTTGFTSVYSATTTPVAGVNTYTFTTPFAWNGTSNLIVQICWGNANTGGAAAEVKYDATSFVATSYYATDGSDASTSCGSTTGQTSGTKSTRPQMYITGNITTGFTSYAWSDGTNTIGTTNPLTTTLTNTGTGPVTNSYTLKATDAGGCTITSSPVAVTVAASLANTSISSTSPICSGQASTVVFSGAANSIVYYTVNNGTTQNVTLNASGTYSLTTPALTVNTTYTVVSATSGSNSSCTQTFSNVSTTITVSAYPTVSSISGPDYIAFGKTGSYSDGTTGGVWSLAANGTGSTLNSTSANPTTITAGTVAGTAVLSYKVTNSSGCATTATKNITIFNNLIAHFRSVQNGKADDINTWEYLNNYNVWVAASSIPVSPDNSSNIEIRDSVRFETSDFDGDTSSVVRISSHTIGSVTTPGTMIVYPTHYFQSQGAVNFGAKRVLLLSASTGTGSIGVMKNLIDSASNVQVERFTDGKPSAQATGSRRAWRLITSPVTGQSIHQAWQENASSNANPNTGYGTLITGYNMPDATTAAAQGYDFTGAGFNASIKRYMIAGNNWVPLSNTGGTPGTLASLQSEQAFLLFIRGDRTIGAGSLNTTSANLRSTGTLQQGGRGVNYAANTPYILMGNPYASTINFGQLIQHNSSIQDQFYSWNSTLGTYGAYVLVTHTGTNGNYEATPDPITGLTTQDKDKYKYIPNGSGFFVMPNTLSAAGTVSFQETDKAAGKVPPINPFRIVNTPTDLRQIIMNLNLRDSDTSTILADGFRAKFSPDFEGSETENSSTKAANLNENLGLSLSNTDYIIEARSEVKKTDTLYMKLWNTSKKKYQFQMKADNFTDAPGISAWLEDSYLQTKQELPLNGSIATINFEVNSDSLSAKTDRFRIVFENNTLVLPVTITKVTAQPKNGGVEVNWSVTNETNIKGYTIEKSVDGGRTFTGMGTQQAAHNNPQAAVTSYSGYDAQPVVGDNYYRILIEAKDGTVTYSTAVKVAIGVNGSGIQITMYPNPVREGKANLQLVNLKPDVYLASVYSGSGQTIFQKKIYVSLANTTQTETLLLGNQLAQGSYQVKLSDSKGNVIFNDQLIVGR